MPDPVGPLTKDYLRRLGYGAQMIGRWNGETRLLQDIGLFGDNARDEFEILRREFDIDLTGLPFGNYFPSELSNESLILTLLPRSTWAARIRLRYPEITLTMIEEALQTKHWVRKPSPQSVER